MTMDKWLILFREIITVYCENHSKHIYTLCVKDAGELNVKAVGTYSNHWVLEG
jgi:hypothetical protein